MPPRRRLTVTDICTTNLAAGIARHSLVGVRRCSLLRAGPFLPGGCDKNAMSLTRVLSKPGKCARSAHGLIGGDVSTPGTLQSSVHPRPGGNIAGMVMTRTVMMPGTGMMAAAVTGCGRYIGTEAAEHECRNGNPARGTADRIGTQGCHQPVDRNVSPLPCSWQDPAMLFHRDDPLIGNLDGGSAQTLSKGNYTILRPWMCHSD